MGQAKARGTLEQRKHLAILTEATRLAKAKKEREQREHEEMLARAQARAERQRYIESTKPNDTEVTPRRNRIASSHRGLGLALAVAALASFPTEPTRAQRRGK